MNERKTKQDDNDDDGVKKNIPIKKMSDLMRLKVEKLMQNIEKPVVIPERPKQKNGPNAPDFVRNVMGSSAGAGSGEFHVYRHLRRKEYSRMKFIQNKSEAEKLDEAYHEKLEENKRKALELTSKKRTKRQKRKEKLKTLKKIKVEKKDEATVESNSDSDSDVSRQLDDEQESIVKSEK